MSLRIAIPPQTLGLYRDVFITVTLLGIAHCLETISRIDSGFDEAKGLEFIELSSNNIDAIAKCIIDLYSIKNVSNARELQQLFYDEWSYSFNANTSSYKLYMGGSTFVKHQMVEYVKFFYARDVKTFDRAETSKGKVPKPISGFLDLGFDAPYARSRILWYFNRYRAIETVVQQQTRVRMYVTASAIPTSHEVLAQYSEILDQFIRLRETKAGYDIVFKENCKTFLTTRLAQEEPDLLSRWFELTIVEQLLRKPSEEYMLASIPPIRVYSVDASNPKIGYLFVEIDIATLNEVIQGLTISAQKLGVKTSTLVQSLKETLEGIAQASSSNREEVSRIASALKTKLRIVLNSAIEGRIDMSMLYSLLRESSQVTEVDPVFNRICRSLARLGT